MAEVKISGRRAVLEALNSNLPLKRIYFRSGAHGSIIEEIRKAAEDKGVHVTVLSARDFERMAGGERHQGVIAAMKKLPLASLDEILEQGRRREYPAVVLLDGIEDPQNFGAILRVAEGAGLAGAIYPARRSAGLTPGAVKASAGAAFHFPVCEVTNLVRTMNELKDQGYWLIGADVHGDRYPWQVDMTMPVGFVLGRENEGLHRLVRETCDFIVQLPMLGEIASYNVATAAGMLFYERMRQMQQKKEEQGMPLNHP